MPDIIPEIVAETLVVSETPVVKAEEAPLGEPGLAALKAEREAHATAVRKLKEYEDRDKTDAQRQAEETETLRRENAELKSGALRTNVATSKGVPEALLAGGTQEELEASADALIAFRGEKSSNPLHVPNEGSSPQKTPSSEAEFLGSLFARGD